MLKELQVDYNAPWKQRFRAPTILWSQLAKAAPERGLVVTNKSGKYQLYAWDVPTGELHQLTAQPTGIWLGWLAPDGHYVYYLDDHQGNEIGHYVRIPFEGGEPQDITPNLPPYSPFTFDGSMAGNRIGFSAADAEGFHIYSLENEPSGVLGARRQLFHSRKLAAGPLFSHGGEIAAIATTERATLQHYNLLAYDVDSGEAVTELWDGKGTSVEALMFSPAADDLRLLGNTNRSGVKRPFLWNPRTGERIDLSLPDLTGEVFPVDWSADARRILLCQFAQAVQQLYVYDLTLRTLSRLDHPSGTFRFSAGLGTYFGPGDEIFAQWQDSTHPSQIIGLNSTTGEQNRTILAVSEEVPFSHAWKSVTFPSSDGQVIQGWLGLPEGEGPFPTILHTHGGPESVTTDIFYPSSQAWIDHGFAFLAINYRGSTTFGREFQERIWGNLGYWEIEDMAAAGEWLVRERIAYPDQILLTGWSYGGYNTLMALGKRPDLWAGGMAGIAITDWRLMYEDSSDTLKGYQVALFGGTPQEKAEQYAASSPITYADNLRAPVLIIQGRNDTRTPARPVEKYEAKLKALGKSIEVHWFEAGHLGADVELDIQHQEIMLRFAYKVLG